MTAISSSIPCTVEIRIGHGVATVDPGCEDLLLPLLTYDDLTFARSANGRMAHQTASRRVYASLPGNRLLIPVGCVHRVCDRLRATGFQVCVRDFRRLDGNPHQISADYRPVAEQSLPGLADAIAAHTEGILEVAQGPQRVRIAGTITRLLPNARCFLAAATRDATHAAMRGLGEYLGGSIAEVHGGSWQSGSRVVCGTFTALDHGDPADWDVVIFLDAAEAVAAAVHDVRANYGRHRLYALADPRRARSPKAELLYETLAGPAIYSISPTIAPAAMTVMLATYGAPSRQLLDDPREAKQQLWADPARNRAIADVATALADGDAGTLWQHEMFLDAEAALLSMPAGGGLVVVIVESIEHAEQLAAQLPGWQIWHRRPGPEGQVMPGHVAGVGLGLPTRLIATIAAAAVCPCIGVQVIVMASGGRWPQVPVGVAQPRGSRTIVDFADESHPGLLADTHARIRVYQDLGYCIHAPARLTTGTSNPEIAQPAANMRRNRQRRNPNTSRRPSRPHRR